MSRSVAWRFTISDVGNWSQTQAQQSTIYILREIGPTGFMLKEENVRKKEKVLIGDPHSCTCSSFRKEKDICKHICWVLLKKFRLSANDPVSWQLELIEREVNELLKNSVSTVSQSDEWIEVERQQGAGADGRDEVVRKVIKDDICPICQDELLSAHRPVTYCRFGCGNNIHIKCMKIYADHQIKSSNSQTITCPLCRTDFGPVQNLTDEYRAISLGEGRVERTNEHAGMICTVCYSCPIVGKVYRCRDCSDQLFCQKCFHLSSADHENHSVFYRTRAHDRWRLMSHKSSLQMIDQRSVADLQSREITEDDYDTLLQLDRPLETAPSDLTEEHLRWFPVHVVKPGSSLLHRAHQCCVCLQGYVVGAEVRLLPCNHRFHKQCIDSWLLHCSPTCPIDGASYTQHSIRAMRLAKQKRMERVREQASSNEGTGGVRRSEADHNLSIIDLIVKPLSLPSYRLNNNRQPHTSNNDPPEQEVVSSNFFKY